MGLNPKLPAVSAESLTFLRVLKAKLDREIVKLWNWSRKSTKLKPRTFNANCSNLTNALKLKLLISTAKPEMYNPERTRLSKRPKDNIGPERSNPSDVGLLVSGFRFGVLRFRVPGLRSRVRERPILRPPRGPSLRSLELRNILLKSLPENHPN